MRIREYRQSDTSPLKYVIELSECEMKLLKSEDDSDLVTVFKSILEHVENIEQRS